MNPEPVPAADDVVPDPAETFHPFEYVLDELEARKISPDMAGRMLQRMAGIKYLQWMEFIAGGRVDDRLAGGLALLFGTGIEVWLKLQRAYDLQHNDGPE
jgi:plasmid maintenance system antidote protein VapI